MKYSLKKIIFLILPAVFLFLIFLNFSKIWSFPDQNWRIEKENKISLDSEKPIMQKFKASHDNLTRIEILFSQSDKKKIGGQIRIQLTKEDCMGILAENFLKVASINSEFTYDFIFPKIKNSKDKAFCLLLSFVSEKETKKTPQVFITNSTIPEDQISLIATTEEELKNQSLSMRPAYKNDTIWQDATELNKRISQYKPWFLKHYFLSFITISFMVLSILLVIILIII